MSKRCDLFAIAVGLERFQKTDLESQVTSVSSI